MKESEWQSWSDEVFVMVNHLCRDQHAHKTKAGKRKLRLFACACGREAWELLEPFSWCREAISVIELFADGQAAQTDVSKALKHEPLDFQTLEGIAQGIPWYLHFLNENYGKPLETAGKTGFSHRLLPK